ncbi:unnamed protein product [Didymodactylos carnosus]|uniref:Uncharacterized protein n=1 Tax=Didymodactylos carnosus TaxID=1234261 RepID=A0A8S2G9G8_9BILA|nr:unnamed protein product [Didymodactylos carnosus]CAF4522579.1 unnamed protein product [Didymodactylos carnosus]
MDIADAELDRLSHTLDIEDEEEHIAESAPVDRHRRQVPNYMQANNGPLGKPQFSVQGAGSAQNGRNWNFGGQVGASAKVWESQNRRHSVGVGGTYGQSFGKYEVAE